MEQSQKAAEPLKPVSPATLVRALNRPEADPGAESPESIENRQRAAAEISMIFELKDNRAFQWFQREFIDAHYKSAFDALRSPHVKMEDLPKLQTTYVALREIKVGMIEREIAHRELMDPADEEIPRLRQLLGAL